MMYSGEILWQASFEALQPAHGITVDNKPPSLTKEEFQQWIDEVSKNTRSQEFTIRAIFKGDYLRFECKSEPGDVLPEPCDRIIAFNKVSVSFIDNTNKTILRESCSDFQENHFGCFYPIPRLCGYGVKETLRLVKKVRDITDRQPEISSEMLEDGSKVSVMGLFSTGAAPLAEFSSDSKFGQVFSQIKFINPIFGNRNVVENSDMVEYTDGTVFPNRTVITRYLGGDLNDLSKSPMIDRMTLKVLNASFGIEYPDELFTPSKPEGYTDLLDFRALRLNQMSGQ